MSFQTIITAHPNGEGLQYDNGTPIGSKQLLGRNGSVTQLTSNATAVSLNATHGKIIMYNGVSGTLANGAGVSFTFTNSKIKTTSLIFLQCQATSATAEATRSNITAMVENVTNPADGSCIIHVYNHDAATSTDAPVINFLIFTPQ